MIAFLPKVSLNLFLLSILFMLAGVETGSAQANFSVVCNDRNIGYEDVVNIQFKIENASHIESFTPPDFKNFTIVGGPNQERGMRSINGKIDEYVSIGFALKPKGPGKWQIGAARTVADGKELKTSPVTIEVSKEPNVVGNNRSHSPFSGFGLSLPPEPKPRGADEFILKPGENAEEKIKDNLFVKLDVNKTSCFVGEPVTAAFKLYTRLRSETTITNAPSFNGFSVSDLDVNEDVSVEKVDGKPYNVYTLRKVQLYPMRSGDITLDPIVSDNKVTFLKSAYTQQQPRDLISELFDGFAQDLAPENAVTQELITLKSKPVVIHVKELPQTHVPAGFKGAVGNFSVNAKLDKQEFSTDGAGNLIVTVSGKGNLQLLNAPEIHWPTGLEGYDPKIDEQVEHSSVPLSGRKVFTYPFTAAKAGEYRFDSITFSYFDPETASFHTLKTDPLHVNIAAGKNNLSPKFGADDSDAQAPLQRYSYEIIFTVLGLIIILFLIIRRKNSHSTRERSLKKEIELDNKEAARKSEDFKIPENILLPLHEKLKNGNASAFYQELNVILKKYLSDKFKIPVEEISRKTINDQLDHCNVGLNTSLMLNSLLEEIELNLYSVAAEHALQQAFEKASQVISLLNKQCSE